MWALTIEFINYSGDIVTFYRPVFESAADCEWWRLDLWKMLQNFNGARELISSSCTRVS